MNAEKKSFTSKRPWGQFTRLTKEKKTTIKIIKIHAGGELSLQSHKFRDEIWVALDSGIVAEVEGKKKLLKKHEKIFVPKKTKHRLSAKKGGRILEIAFGKFDENDITRYEDKYGRAKTPQKQL